MLSEKRVSIDKASSQEGRIGQVKFIIGRLGWIEMINILFKIDKDWIPTKNLASISYPTSFPRLPAAKENNFKMWQHKHIYPNVAVTQIAGVGGQLSILIVRFLSSTDFEI